MPANQHSHRMLMAFGLLLPLLFLGCGSYEGVAPSSELSSIESDATGSSVPQADNGLTLTDTQAIASELTAGAEPDPNNLAAAESREPQRKIIYTTQVGLVVEDYQVFEAAMPKLVEKHGGFIASSDTDRRYNNNQSGTWIVRVPIDQYSAFLAGVSGLGFAESRSENAQDVTEEYVDLETRIANKKKLEARILTMLDERTGKLADVLEIERELARVREEVERMEGRLRFLRDRTSLATITISCREEKEYTPPQTPTLLSRISWSWFDSLTSLRRSGENLLVGLIAAVPWLVAWGIPLFIGRWGFKRWWRKRRAKKTAS